MLFLEALINNILYFIMPEKYCRHRNVNPMSPNHFCPDCGKEIIIDWYIIKCSGCNAKRSGYHVFNEFLPYQQYCKKCGESAYSLEIKQELYFFEYSYAAYKAREAEKITVNKSKTVVWLDAEYSKVYEFENKNLKMLPVLFTS